MKIKKNLFNESKDRKKDTDIIKRPTFDITIIDKYIAGICLSGNEIKSVRAKNISIKSCYIICRNNEVNVFDLFIKNYKNSNASLVSENERRKRKLLLKKSEIKKISKSVKEKGHIVSPLRIFISSGKWAKIEIAVSQKKRNFQIKSDQKEKDLKRKIEKKDFFD